MTDTIRQNGADRRSTPVRKKAMITALKRHLMHVTLACKDAQICRDSYYGWLKKDKKFLKQVELAQERIYDLAEAKLQQHIKGGSLDATKFFLSTKVKHRGYMREQKIEHTGSMHEQIKINVIMPKEDKAEPAEDTSSEIPK